VTSPAHLEDRRRLVEEALSRALPPESAWPATIHRAVRYSLFAGGKRVRPLLTLAAGETVGGTPEELMPLAVAAEMVHTYSLIHDDLPCMDDDDLRRGKPTSHKVFGEAVAVLAGDALLTRAFHVMAEVPPSWDGERLRRRMAAIAILGEAAGTAGLIGGQVEDMESEGRRIDAAALERLHRAKTGALLGACVRGGAVLGGAAEDDLARLERYAAASSLPAVLPRWWTTSWTPPRAPTAWARPRARTTRPPRRPTCACTAWTARGARPRSCSRTRSRRWTASARARTGCASSRA
jgi:geranylgeranyl diphosphate synthase, type II